MKMSLVYKEIWRLYFLINGNWKCIYIDQELKKSLTEIRKTANKDHGTNYHYLNIDLSNTKLHLTNKADYEIKSWLKKY